MFWSEIGSGFGDEPGGTPPPRIPRSTHWDFFTSSFLLSCVHILEISPFAIKKAPATQAIDKGPISSYFKDIKLIKNCERFEPRSQSFHE